MRKTTLLLVIVLFISKVYGAENFTTFSPLPSHFKIVDNGTPINIVYDSSEDIGIQIAINNLQNDINAVCGNKPIAQNETTNRCILIGSTHSALIKPMLKNGKIKRADIEGKVEKFLLQTIKNPIPGVDEALVIVGSDRRGTIYGIYELSKQIGV